YPDGGAMSYRAGIKLVTHPNTGKVYAVEPAGVLRWLPSAEIAVALYGENWANLVQDLIPGYFASSYTKGDDIESMLPNGTIVREKSSNTYYYIIDGQKRKFLDTSTLAKNNFSQYQAIEAGDLSIYSLGEDILDAEDSLSSFQPLDDSVFEDNTGDVVDNTPEPESPIKDQKILLLTHSVGRGLYEEGGISQWFENYNTDNNTQVQIEQRDYPNDPYQWSNFPHDFWNLWINGYCDNTEINSECLDSLASKYDLISFKNSYEASDVLPDIGGSSAAVNSTRKSLENYKLQYRALRDLLDQYPNDIFVVWTLPPRHHLHVPGSDTTALSNASRATEFSNWLKSEWLTEDSKAHDNIFVFDFRSYLIDEKNYLKFDYESTHTWSESHPNKVANELVAPILSEFLLNTIVEYNQ
ncbi:MAG: hypothetical protein Q8O32_00380, partial [bacterium]|nr:hypothetical protein [bacterium]